VINSAGGSAHVLFPGIASGFSSAAGLLFSSESSADFGAAGSDIAVHDSAVGAERAHPFVHLAQVVREKRGREALRHVVVKFDCFFQALELHDVQNGHKELILQNLSLAINFHQSGFHIVAFAFDGLASGQNLSALFLDLLKSVHENIDLPFGVQRSA